MIAMKFTALVTVLALILTLFFGARVGGMRGKKNIKAPAVEGDELFERAFRVHYNTLENLVVFIPLLWLATGVIGDIWSAAVGALWLVGRVLYSSAYLKDPATRGPGMIITFLPMVALLVVVLWGIVRQFL